MFDVAPTELLLLAVVALVVIGPKDLPRAMRFVGQWVGRARGMARHFRTGIDEMIRQSELEEMEKKWREENERIMREFPTIADPVTLEAKPLPPADVPPDAQTAMTALPPPDEAATIAPSADLANWHAAGETPAAEAVPPADAAAPPPAAPSVAPPQASTPSEPVEEQLSLLPPEPAVRPASSGEGKPKLP